MGRQASYTMLMDVIRCYEDVLSKPEYRGNKMILNRLKIWKDRRDETIRNYQYNESL